jgi:ElaB/YqjD/DUF883 family membrane-anchored ribosome-binding protein
MKAVLALAVTALIALMMEEKARQLAGDAQQAVTEASHQARVARDTLSDKMENQPLLGVAVAAAIGFVLAKLLR